MALTLPAIMDKTLAIPYFPTAYQTYIFRMWQMIEPRVMADVLGCAEDDIAAAALEMGLEDGNFMPQWKTFGYITIIRALWHIAPYEQICATLGWDEEKLAFTLREDDFLSVKLGNFKPNVPPLHYRPLTVEEHERTSALAHSVRKFYSSLAPCTASPFDFKTALAGVKYADIRDIPSDGKNKFDVRIAYSYCALYGDTFTENTDYSFPDELLEAYSRLGVNGIWCQAVLSAITPYPFMPELSEGYERRVDGMRELTQRMARYGIKLYLYINEPRALPNAFFDTHEELRGQREGDYTCLCTSSPRVREYITGSAEYLCRNVPLLGGFITITASENQTNCYSHVQTTDCPRCSGREPWRVRGEINALLYEGARAVNPDFRVIAWTWGWRDCDVADAAASLPAGIDIMAVSEHSCEKTVGGVKTDVNDYSISVVGPGKYSLDIWNAAISSGHRACAKVQLNNSWEMSAVPYLPLFHTVYRHLSNLIESGVGSIMLDWTLGGYPSPMFAMMSEMSRGAADGAVPPLEDIIARLYPAAADAVIEASKLFCGAFDNYPFNISTIYNGPHNVGTANPLYTQKTGFSATMVGYPYDDLTSWRSIYPEAVFENQWKLVSEGWRRGMAALDAVSPELYSQYPALRELYDCADAALCHFESVYEQIRFVRARDTGDADTMRRAALSEGERAIKLA
ncbi:MAG: hypothetical protein WCQ72_08710, partial [Eubacteriales bacterium]